MEDVLVEKSGVITISVYKKSKGEPLLFSIKSDNEDELFDIEYIIEDALKMY